MICRFRTHRRHGQLWATGLISGLVVCGVLSTKFFDGESLRILNNDAPMNPGASPGARIFRPIAQPAGYMTRPRTLPPKAVPLLTAIIPAYQSLSQLIHTLTTFGGSPELTLYRAYDLAR